MHRDVFPLGSTGKFVAMASLYNWAAGGYYTNGEPPPPALPMLSIARFSSSK